MAFLMAYAVSVRAVAQLLPFLVIFVFLAIPQRFFPSAKKRILRGCLISMSVVILLMALWAYRNYQVEGLFAVAGTGPGAAAAYLGERVAAAESDSLSVRDYIIMFNRELKDWMSAGENTTRRYNEWCMKKIKELIKANPIAFAQAYLSTVWENVTAYDEFPQFRFPRYKSQFIHLTEVVRKCKIDKIVLCLTLIGIIVLIAQGKFLIGILFSAIYAYFALISGFTWGQGSRIFYPSQTTGALLLATGAYYSYLYAWNKFGYILYQKTMSFLSPYSRKIFRDSQLRYIRPLAILAIIMIIFFSMVLTLLHSRTPTYRAVANTGNQVFGDKIVLSQIRLEEKNDATIAVLFDCYSLSKVDENYRFYLHLNPISGGPMINRDFAPGTPMSFWQPYIIETERRELNVKPGEYNVVMGIFYNVQRYLGDPYSFKITLK